jgi:SAM-dependent methyltransferase
VKAVWHDLECGPYTEDLALWLDLAARYGDPILDIGAGTGRTAIALARAGHAVTAVDHDPELLAELGRRSTGLELETWLADARELALGGRFALCIVPMQTIQLLGGRAGRACFLRALRDHLREGGMAALALADEVDVFEVQDGSPAPLPDVCELDGVLYSSRPTAVRADDDSFELVRRREMVTGDGTISVQDDVIRLDRLSAIELEAEAEALGLRPAGRQLIDPTDDYVGSVVVMLGV